MVMTYLQNHLFHLGDNGRRRIVQEGQGVRYYTTIYNAVSTQYRALFCPINKLDENMFPAPDSDHFPLGAWLETRSVYSMEYNAQVYGVYKYKYIGDLIMMRKPRCTTPH